MFDTGNTGFMLVATSLVMLMTPGLAFFYGGLVGRKNVLAIMIQSFVSMGWTTVIWFTVGYSLCFSGDVGGIIGNLDMAFLRGVTSETVLSPDQQYPAPRVHRLPDDVRDHHPGPDHRRLRQPGPLRGLHDLPDGLAALRLLPGRPHDLGRRAAPEVGRPRLRRRHRRPRHRRHGGPGLGLLRRPAQGRREGPAQHSRWSRSAPVCCGSAGTASTPAASCGSTPSRPLAFLNTDIAASFAAITWLLLAWIFEKKPKFLGLLTGAVAGLATITPAAGYVTVPVAVLIGIVAGAVCYAAINWKNKMGWDDALDVWGVHGVGGMLGIILLGIFATTKVNPAGADGLLLGGTAFFFKQAAAVIGFSAYAFVFTYVALFLINKITKVRITAEEENMGLDTVLHGEEAYIPD